MQIPLPSGKLKNMIGTPKQIAWATRIQQDAIDLIAAFADDTDRRAGLICDASHAPSLDSDDTLDRILRGMTLMDRKCAELLAKYRAETSAKWWIENRFEVGYPEIRDFMRGQNLGTCKLDPARLPVPCPAWMII